MTIRERFEKYSLMCKEIQQLEDSIAREEYQLKKLDISLMLTHPVSGAEVQRIEKRLLKMGEDYVEQMEQLYSEKFRLEKLINCLEDSRERIIMRYRYIDLYKWHIICHKIGYERSQVFRLHQSALKKLESLVCSMNYEQIVS